MSSLEKRKKKIRGILFDKDGTLIDFKSVWIPMALELTGKLLSGYGLALEYKEALLGRIGMFTDGKLAPGSIYASGTMKEVAEALYIYMGQQEVHLPAFEYFVKSIGSEVDNYMALHKSIIRPIGNVACTLGVLREKGLTLGVSTSDSEKNTRICLEETGLIKYFSYIGCPDGRKKPKPSGDILMEFSLRYGISPQEVAIVGDTPTDIAFARLNGAGLAIGVLSGAGDENSLSDAHLVLHDVNRLTEFIRCF